MGCNPSIGRGPVLTITTVALNAFDLVLQSLYRAWACSDLFPGGWVIGFLQVAIPLSGVGLF